MSETDEQYNVPTELPRDQAVCPSKLRKAILQEFEGRCYWCAIEEWRLGKRLHMHRVLDKHNGGIYEWGNVVPLCPSCHRRAEGESPDVVHASSWVHRQSDNFKENHGLMSMLGEDQVITYRPRLNAITGNAIATIVLCQAIYWWRKSGFRSFYKFSAPCAHKLYREGDSWQEELGLTRHEMDGALKRLGRRIKRGESLDDALKQSFLVWWMDGEKVTWYSLNAPLIESRLADIYGMAGGATSLDDEIPQRPDGPPEVNAEIRHRGGGVNAEIRQPIYDAGFRQPIIKASKNTPKTTSSDKYPVPSSSNEADGELERIKSRERTAKGKIRGLTNDEAAVLIRDSMEGDVFVEELRTVYRTAASKNKTNEMSLTKVWSSFVEPYLQAREQESWSDESWAYGFKETIRRETGSIGYVMSCAKSHHTRESAKRNASSVDEDPFAGTSAGKSPEKPERDYSWFTGPERELTPEELQKIGRASGE